MMTSLGLGAWSSVHLLGVQHGFSLCCSAALFITAGCSPVLLPMSSLVPCLSLGAEPSRSRSPWVKLSPLSFRAATSLALTIVRSTDAKRKTKKPLATAPGNGSHALTGTGACANGFILLTVTTTGRTLAYFPNHVNTRVNTIRTNPKIVITMSPRCIGSSSRHSGLRGKASVRVRGCVRVVLLTLGSWIRIMLFAPFR